MYHLCGHSEARGLLPGALRLRDAFLASCAQGAGRRRYATPPPVRDGAGSGSQESDVFDFLLEDLALTGVQRGPLNHQQTCAAVRWLAGFHAAHWHSDTPQEPGGHHDARVGVLPCSSPQPCSTPFRPAVGSPLSTTPPTLDPMMLPSLLMLI